MVEDFLLEIQFSRIVHLSGNPVHHCYCLPEPTGKSIVKLFVFLKKKKIPHILLNSALNATSDECPSYVDTRLSNMSENSSILFVWSRLFLSCCCFILGATMRKTETADLSRLSPTEQKRQIVIQELMNTEENYMEDMSIVNEV